MRLRTAHKKAQRRTVRNASMFSYFCSKYGDAPNDVAAKTKTAFRRDWQRVRRLRVILSDECPF